MEAIAAVNDCSKLVAQAIELLRKATGECDDIYYICDAIPLLEVALEKLSSSM